MRQRNFLGPFLAMHRNVPYFDLEVKRNYMETADFGAAPRNAFDLADHPPAHVGLERISRGVPQGSQHSDQNQAGGYQQIFPPAARSRGWLGHRVCPPSMENSVAPGKLTLLSERRDCSHETINSLTFCSVSSSRILPETSASETSPAPDSFNCGTNFSR